MRASLLFCLICAVLVAGCAGPGPIAGNREAAPVRETPPPVPPVPAPPQPTPSPLPGPPAAVIPPVFPGQAEARSRLLRLMPPAAPDRAGWATDILSAFDTLRIPPTAENFCAAIAVIEQESSFQADPVVPGLPRIVWGEIEKRRQKYLIPKLLLDAAFRKPSPDGRSYKARVNALRTEREMNVLFEDMISELPYGRTLLSGYNPIRTGGPMQVSVDFAEGHVRQKGYPYAGGGSIRDEVFSRRGGVFFGIAILLDYPAPYSQPIFRFADYNAGRYSSRNAAFQAAVAKLARKKLELDGDLLRYEKGEPSPEPSATLKALHTLAGRLGLGRGEIRRDLLLEKSAPFGDSAVYRRVFALADAGGKAALPREILPRIVLKSPKITRHLTTEWFARRVDGRYRGCLARGRFPG
ncbi:MAG: DUF1615 domain-containing protein [Rhodocyclaceae bacterium]|nr:DUF1615 domain-containing protein [Rhodocyclaceae bacterium]